MDIFDFITQEEIDALATIRRAENGGGSATMIRANALTVIAAMKALNLEFLPPSPQHGEGVRFIAAPHAGPR